MKEERKVTKDIIIKGNVLIEDVIKKIPKGFAGTIVVDGNVIAKSGEKFEIPCSLSANKLYLVYPNRVPKELKFLLSFKLIDRYVYPTLFVKGNLTCKGKVVAGNINITGNFICEGGTDMENLEVGGNVISRKNIKARRIKLGKDLICESKILSLDINVARNLTCRGNIDSISIKVGEKLDCRGKVDCLMK